MAEANRDIGVDIKTRADKGQKKFREAIDGLKGQLVYEKQVMESIPLRDRDFVLLRLGSRRPEYPVILIGVYDGILHIMSAGDGQQNNLSEVFELPSESKGENAGVIIIGREDRSADSTFNKRVSIDKITSPEVLPDISREHLTLSVSEKEVVITSKLVTNGTFRGTQKSN